MSDKILKDDPTKTITEKGAFTPKKSKSKINLGKGFGRAGIVGAGITVATIAGKKIKEMADEGKMPKTKKVLDRVTDVLNKAGEAYKDLGQAGLNVIRGNVDKKSMGGETKLSPKQMKIARMAPPPDQITGADFKAMKASNGKMIMARGCKMGKNKPTKLS
jgi:hypothetical protein